MSARSYWRVYYKDIDEMTYFSCSISEPFQVKFYSDLCKLPDRSSIVFINRLIGELTRDQEDINIVSVTLKCMVRYGIYNIIH